MEKFKTLTKLLFVFLTDAEANDVAVERRK